MHDWTKGFASRFPHIPARRWPAMLPRHPAHPWLELRDAPGVFVIQVNCFWWPRFESVLTSAQCRCFPCPTGIALHYLCVICRCPRLLRGVMVSLRFWRVATTFFLLGLTLTCTSAPLARKWLLSRWMFGCLCLSLDDSVTSSAVMYVFVLAPGLFVGALARSFAF